jgi:uncharacterized protein DUF3108
VRPVLSAIALLAGAALNAQPPLPKLTYDIEWRLIRAGTAVMEPFAKEGRVKLDSAGLVSALYKVDNTYSVRYDAGFCAANSVLDAKQGKWHRETNITFDRVQNRAIFVEKDVTTNTVLRSTQVEIPNCVHDIIGSLLLLRGAKVEPGQSTQIIMSDGRKAAPVKIDAQEREQVTTSLGKFNTIRYEVNMLDGVVYQRKGRVFVWLTDDARRLPVQIRMRFSFPVGTVTLQLEKEEMP